MIRNNIPWKNIAEFHREIAIRSEESFFTFELEDQSNERFSYISNGVVHKADVSSVVKQTVFSNQTIFSNIDQKSTGFYVGGILWFTNKKIDDVWVKYSHPLFYKPFNIEIASNEKIALIPEQAKWDVSPLFYKLLICNDLLSSTNYRKSPQTLLSCF